MVSIKAKLKWILENFLELIAGTGLVVAVTVTVINAFTRYVFKYTYAGSSEIVSIAFVWCIFPGAAAAYKHNMHYGMDIFIGKLSPKGQSIAMVISRFIVVVLITIVAFLSFRLLTQVGTKKMPATYISYFWYDLPAVIAFFCMIIHSIKLFFEEIKNLKNLGKEA